MASSSSEEVTFKVSGDPSRKRYYYLIQSYDPDFKVDLDDFVRRRSEVVYHQTRASNSRARSRSHAFEPSRNSSRSRAGSRKVPSENARELSKKVASEATKLHDGNLRDRHGRQLKVGDDPCQIDLNNFKPDVKR